MNDLLQTIHDAIQTAILWRNHVTGGGGHFQVVSPVFRKECSAVPTGINRNRTSYEGR